MINAILHYHCTSNVSNACYVNVSWQKSMEKSELRGVDITTVITYGTHFTEYINVTSTTVTVLPSSFLCLVVR